MKQNNKKYIIGFIILLAVMTLTVGFASLTNTVLFNDMIAIFRLPEEIRVTNFYVSGVSNNGESDYDEYNYNNVSAGITLPNQNSTVTYKVEITNLGNFVGQIESVTGLPENITYEFGSYTLGDNICDSQDRCRNGISKEIFITFKYVENGYDSNNPTGEYDVTAVFEFSKNYLVTYVGDIFYANPHGVQYGVTADYDPTTSILTLNGTQTTNSSTSVMIMHMNNLTFVEGDTYSISLEYISGSFTNTDYVTFATQILTNNDQGLSTANYSDTPYPSSGVSTTTLTINSAGANEGGVIRAILYENQANAVTFSNYRIKVQIKKIETISNELNSEYVMPDNVPVRNTYIFGGWFTAETGGQVVNNGDIMGVPSDHTLYAHWYDEDILASPTISYESNYVTSGLQLLLDGRNNTGNGYDGSITTWKNIANNSNVTLYNGTWEEGSLSFPGSSSGAIASTVNSSYYTLEAIVELSEIQSAEVDILSNFESGGIGLNLYNGYARATAYIGGSYINLITPEVLELNQRYALSCSYDGTTLKLFVNGALVDSKAVSGTVGAPSSNTVFALGCNPSGSSCAGYNFHGKVFSARIYNRALTYNEILHNYVTDTLYVNNYTNINPYITISGGSSNIGMDGYRYKVNSGSLLSYSSSNKPVINTAGENIIEAYTANIKGTLSEVSTANVIIDNDNPTASVALSYNKSIVTATVTASDTTSEIYNYGYSISGSQTCNADNIFTYSYNNIYSFQITSAGTKYLCVKVTDLASNSTYISNEIKSNYYPDTNNSYYTFNVPSSGYYYIETWGAEGGMAHSSQRAGEGGYSAGYINLSQNETLYIYVGSAGGVTPPEENVSVAGGYNGGGRGNSTFSGTGRIAGSGGGATDVRLTNGSWDNDTSLNSRIIVAGGGGGSWYVNNYYYGYGGHGGTLLGETGLGHHDTLGTIWGSGGTQTQVLFGKGADAPSATERPGGGGGYYGGSNDAFTSGGGSSFISGYAGVNAIDYSRTHTNNTKHYSNKYFIDGTMQLGTNSGSGKARITYYGSNRPPKINTDLEGVRYVRDCINGSTSNAWNHWIELQAIKDGVNLAKGKTPIFNTETMNGRISYLNDGIIDIIGNYSYEDKAGLQCVTIDLENTYDLDEVAVWHYYNDGRTYYNNGTFVSSDNVNWKLIKNTTEQETVHGKRINAWQTGLNESTIKMPKITYYANRFGADASQTTNGLTISYNKNTSVMTINGTFNTTSTPAISYLPGQTFKNGEVYKVKLTYVSGTFTSSVTPDFVFEISKNGTIYTNRANGTHYLDNIFPPSGSYTTSLTITNAVTDGDGLYFWLWQSTDNATTFNNYSFKVELTKEFSAIGYVGGKYYTSEFPTRYGWYFTGWYTAESGGTQVTSYTNITNENNHTLYAHWDDSDNAPPTLSVYVPNGTTIATNHNATITIADNIGLASGTYAIRYAWGTSASACSSLGSTTSITVSAGETSKSVSVNINYGTGYGNIYVCNYDNLRDIAGNKLNASTVVSAIMYQDNTAPVGSIDASTSNIIGCSDEMGVVAYYFGTSWPDGVNGYSWMTITYSFSTNYNITAAGTYYLSCRDSAGNFSSVQSYNYKQITVTYHRNRTSSDTSTASQIFIEGRSGNQFGKKTDGSCQFSSCAGQFGAWDYSGHTLLGWNETSSATTKKWNTYSGVSNNWIRTYQPTKHLYAVWQSNHTCPAGYSLHELNPGWSSCPECQQRILLTSDPNCKGGTKAGNYCIRCAGYAS